MKNYFFKQVLLPEGWCEDVRVSIDSDGNFADVYKNSPQFPNDIVLDCVIPMVPNCHSHVFQRTMAGLTEYKTSANDSFWSWRDLMYHYANKIDATQMYHIAKYTYWEMLEAGYSSVCEFHYIHRDLTDKSNTLAMSMAIIRAAHDVGMRLTLLPVLYTQAHIDGTPLNELQQRFFLTTDEYISLYQTLKSCLYPEQNIGLCFHSLRATSIKLIQTVLNALEAGQPIHIHIAEQTAEVEQCLKHTGKRPIELLFEHFKANHNWNLVHATHLTSKEIDLITAAQSVTVLCPMTEANLGDGIFPLSEYIANKGRFTIGSDSHILLNPFQEMQILEYSQRLNDQQRIIASSSHYPHVGTFLWQQSIQFAQQSHGFVGENFQIGHKANWLSIDTQNPLLTQLNGPQCLDSLIFADNHISVQAYLKGQKLTAIDENTLENYKNIEIVIN